MYGNTSIVHFALKMFSHILGAIAAYTMAAKIGFAAPSAPAHGLSFGEWNWKTFFFGREFWGIFLFCLFHSKHSNDSGIPEKLWTMLIMAVAFQVGGGNFVFVQPECLLTLVVLLVLLLEPVLGRLVRLRYWRVLVEEILLDQTIIL